jgi:LPXTG-motif cell wall-anchored protein
MKLRRFVVAVSAGVLAAGLFGGPAFAHVEVEADKTQAGAKDVTLTFTGEAESGSAGIRSERVVLPTGVAPAGVKLVKAPKGWKFSAAADGFTIAGPALKVGQDAVFAVRLAQLPADATSLSFKTLETYSDGDIVRWIELPQDGQPEPDHPAPTIKLKGAVKTVPASPSPSPSATPASSAEAPVPAESAVADEDSGSSATVWWIVLAVVVVAAAGGLLLWRRRKAA